MTNAQPPTPIDTPSQVDMLLEEAEAFRRGGSPLEALARARVAHDLLTEHIDSIDDDTAEELSARVAFALQRYERLAGFWQEENAERRTSYLRREQSTLRDPRKDH